MKGDSYYVSCLETQLIVTNLKNVHNFSPGRHTHTERQTHSALNPLITCLLKTLQGLPICKSALYAECDGGMEMSNCSRWRPPKKKKKRKGEPHLHKPINPKHSEESQVIYNITESIIKIHCQSLSLRHRVNAQFNEG